MPARPEIAAATIVLVGNFNPLIFRPDWFVQKDILAKEEVEAAVKDETIRIIHPEIVEFQVPTFRITVERTRFVAMTLLEPLVGVFDLVYSAFRALPETPVSALGINREAHYPLVSQERWHALGDLLAPKDHWDILLQNDNEVRMGGLRTLVMERSQRQDGRAGSVQVKIEPSLKIENGVFVFVNDHYELAAADETIPAEDAIEILKDAFKDSMHNSLKLIEHVVALSDA